MAGFEKNFIRLVDIFLATAALTLLSPILLLACLILRFSGEREVFFKQPRVGYYGEDFMILKFATMLKNSPNIGTGTVTIKDDPRVLPVGKLLRATKINELPQLINVIKGDMSIIGPRPQTRRCFSAFPNEAQSTLIDLRPGLSGIGSIVFRSEEEMLANSEVADDLYDKVIMPYKAQLEVWFMQNQSIKVYGLLIILTVIVVLTKNAKLGWLFFSDLPRPPKEIERYIL